MLTDSNLIKQIWKSFFYDENSKNIRRVFLFLITLFFIDQLFFGFLIWRLPNESPWGTNHFFNFMYEKKRIERTPKTRSRILVIGSSIGYYSIDRELLTEYLKEKTGNSFEVAYLSFAGMTPLDSFLVRDDIEFLKPDLVIYPVNFIDLRLHRAYLLDLNGTNEKANDNDLLIDALNFGEAPQSKFTFPEKAIEEFYSILPAEKIATYMSSYVFLFYRYREIYPQNLKNLYNHRFGRNTSYHGYAGVQIPERINSLGWTGKSFSFIPKQYMFEKGFWIQIVPEILAEGNLNLTLKGEVEKEILNFSESGWKLIKLNPKFQKENSYITAELSKTWQPYLASGDRFDHSRDQVGVRLQQTFGLNEPNSDRQYLREERIEDLRYLNMNDNDYKEYFEYRLLSDLEHRPGILYLHALKNAKLRLTKETFRPNIHLQYLKKFTETMKEKKIPVLLINNPENPLAMDWYEKSVWYQNHLLFLKSLESGNEIKFIDFRNNLKMQDFSDFHHFTYSGMVKMNSHYGDEIVKVSRKTN
ncbi:MAG: hypothetical protein IPL26_06195 [Leptospiraceae bacterium]|nr:hypothetical protein [Leptospiraceae bacterium]